MWRKVTDDKGRTVEIDENGTVKLTPFYDWREAWPGFIIVGFLVLLVVAVICGAGYLIYKSYQADKMNQQDCQALHGRFVVQYRSPSVCVDPDGSIIKMYV